MKKHISALLLFAMILSVVSCGGTEEQVDETTTAAEETTAAPTLEDKRHAISDELPDKKYGGKEFTIYVNTPRKSDFVSDEINGDVLSDAVYERNKAIEDRFEVKLNYLDDTYLELTPKVRTAVTAGDDEYQLVVNHALASDSLVIGDMLMNWYDVPYVDFDKPWWSETNRNDLTYNGAAFLAVGDFSLSTIGSTYAIYYDKDKAESYQLPDLYQLVYDGKWTIDKLSELTKDIYEDLNRDGKRGFEDFYGYTTSTASNIGAYLFAFGCKIIDKGEIVLDVGKTAAIIEKLITVTQVNPGTYYDVNYKNSEGNIHNVGPEKMAAGTTLFASASVDAGIKFLRDADDYGILPYPKWDEEQDDYITIIDGGFAMMMVPKSVVDVEMTGIITEALCATTYKDVVPVYYDIALKTKGTRDEESMEMIDFIISKRVCDFGYVYDNWRGLGFVLEAKVKAADPNFASYYAANIDRVTAEYQKVFNEFENYNK